jgi:hypothetical protein
MTKAFASKLNRNYYSFGLFDVWKLPYVVQFISNIFLYHITEHASGIGVY